MSQAGRKKDVARRTDAFADYRKVRNLNQVSRNLGIPVVTLSKWKKEEDWDLKIQGFQERVQKHMDLLDEAKKDVSLKQDVVELNFLKHLEGLIADKVVSGELQPESWKDVLDTLKYVDNQRRLLTGKPTSRVSTSEISTTEKIEEDKVVETKIKKLQRLTEMSGTSERSPGDSSE